MLRGGRRDSGDWESVRALSATMVACLFAWALIGGWLALLAALVAGVGLVLVAVAPEDRPRRRVR